MPLTNQSEAKAIYLQVKHYSIWREVKKPVQGAETVEVNNPRTGAKVTKYGFKYRSVAGRITKLLKYDTADKYPTRYFGFKLHIQDGVDLFILDMPYQSSILRRFLRVAPNIDFTRDFALTVFKGKGEKAGKEETGIWFQQDGQTIKPYYTRERPNGMPDATQDPMTHEWDFRTQHRWLVERLIERTIPAIEAAAALSGPPADVEREHADPEPQPDSYSSEDGYIPSDDDVPF